RYRDVSGSPLFGDKGHLNHDVPRRGATSTRRPSRGRAAVAPVTDAAFSLARPLDDRTPGVREAFRRQVRVDGRAIPGLVVVEGGSLGVGLGGCDTLGADPQPRQGD